MDARVMSEELLGRILNELMGMRADLDGMRADLDGVRVELSGLRTEQERQRVEIETLRRDITRLRTDLSAQMERVLNEQAALRDDMTVVMARLDRVDTTSHGAVTELRALHRQFTRLAARVTALEEPKAND
jgi:uncharacterized protein (DUF3084 family)